MMTMSMLKNIVLSLLGDGYSLTIIEVKPSGFSATEYYLSTESFLTYLIENGDKLLNEITEDKNGFIFWLG